MKKYLISGLFLSGLLMFSPFLVKAQVTMPSVLPPETPITGIVRFLDNNAYDLQTGTWKCQFLMDGNCYDLNQNILMSIPPTSAVSTPVVAGNGQTLNFPTNSFEPVPQIPAPQVQPPDTSYYSDIMPGTGTTFGEAYACVPSANRSCLDPYMISLAHQFCRPVWLAVTSENPANKNYCTK